MLAVFIFLQSESTHPNWLLDGAMVCWCGGIIISVQYPLLMSSVFLKYHQISCTCYKTVFQNPTVVPLVSKWSFIVLACLSPEVVMSSIVVSEVNVCCVSPLLRWDYNWMCVAVDCKRRLLCNECIRANYRSSDAANLFPIIPNLIYCFVICWFSYSPCHPRLQPPARPRTQTQNIRIGGDRSLSKQTPLFCPHLS